MRLLLCLALAGALTLVLTPPVRRLAIRVGALDRPNKRKVHTGLMPRLGGLAIFLSFWLTVLLTQPITSELKAFALGSLLILISGILDDLRGLSPWMKLAFQFAAALTVIRAGIRVTFITNLFAGTTAILGWLSTPLTLLWIMGMTNAINLVDGLDGLAAGVSGIAAVTIGVIACLEGFTHAGVLSLILAAAALAFLKYNFHPAQVFMGDSGSLFLGYALAVLSVMGLTKMATTVSLFLPIVILGVPILDTLLAILRRLINHRPIFDADKGHLHHRLLAMGLSHTRAVLVVYGVAAFLGLTAIGISLLPTGQAMMVIGAVTLVTIYIADKIGVAGQEAGSTAWVRSHRKKKVLPRH